MPENGRRSPVSITRRTVLIGLGATALTGAGTGAYAVGVEPLRLSVTRNPLRPTPPRP